VVAWYEFNFPVGEYAPESVRSMRKRDAEILRLGTPAIPSLFAPAGFNDQKPRRSGPKPDHDEKLEG
jgi:hypothetical protein